MQRRDFITVSVTAAGLWTTRLLAQTAPPADAPPRPKGRPESKVTRWDVITVGNLSRNEYWGEGRERAVRPILCTSTLIRGDGFALLVDPPIKDAGQIAREFDRRTGKKLDIVTACFITHEHGDHWPGIENFPQARWLASPGVAESLNRTAGLSKKIEPAEGRLFDALDVVPSPGHTRDHCSLRFNCAGRSIATAGDAVATLDFFHDRRGFYNSADFEQAARSMDKLAALADIIVPGHDNYFVVD